MQLSHVSVRQLGPDDWQITRELRLAALRDSPEAFGGTYEQAQDRTEQQWRIWPMHGVVYAAYLDGVPVGLACGWLPEDSPGVAELISMWVAAAARGRGIAGALIHAVVAWACQQGATVRLEVMAGNSTARRAYARHGFTLDDRPANCSYTVALRLTPARPAEAAETHRWRRL